MNPDETQTQPTEPEAPNREETARRAAMDAYAEAAEESAAASGTEAEGEQAGQDPDSSSEEARVPTLEELATALKSTRSELEKTRDQLLRTRAETENLRRRHANELEKAHKFALDGFVKELLQVRDSLELGHAAAMDESADLDKLREGTDLTLKLMSDVMNKFGVAEVDPLNEPFNPEFHQAMSMQPRDDVPANTVVGVIQKGFMLNGRLVRPALVMVSREGS